MLKENRDAIQEERGLGGLGCMSDGLGWPRRIRRETSGEIRSHFSMIQPQWPFSSFSIAPRYVTPYPHPREAKWVQPSALAEMQKVLPWEDKWCHLQSQFQPVSNLLST